MRKKTFTLQQIYKEGIKRLREAGIKEAELDAWYLLEFITGTTKASYYGEPAKEVDGEKALEYLELIRIRSTRVPLQHITGEQEFMGYSFQVNDHVLIPRQDTETLVEEALKISYTGMKVLDMCTGSGCILLSMVKMKPGIEGTGCDISEEALRVAEANRKRLEVRAKFIQSDLFEHIEDTYDMIVSNPPYIRTDVIAELQDEVRLHDPWIALDGKEDGLFFYRKIVCESGRYLKKGGTLLFEIGHDQGKAVSELMKAEGYSDVKVKKDLAGLDRVVIGMYNKE
ncbi:peptide chain release factor N(5)-glutamine methyltransferase [Faecalicatena contorta]|uniref:peptide chain release factor N(5)-glutamine methyltransferase n=1 Tax=Faecalicatena contorta TaxID=39482 RepID=UPI001F40E161|nr:peptide chain release factor N(5)-glutamine methyltransferase [Faecalicatena contorta]MCF2682144.1 peptide chain release factor N(5)-glutamine methyltransferase [Faecalicatena contorta]